MNRQQRSNQRSLALHRAIADKLRQHPELWRISQNNIKRWKEKMGGLPPALLEWEYLLKNRSKRQILTLLENSQEEAIRLRSSSPFAGILTQEERMKIFKIFQTTHVNETRI